MNAIFPAANVPVRMAVQEFLDWAEVNDGRWELVDGEPRAMTPPLRAHSAIVGELARILGNHLEEHRPSWSVLVDPAIVPATLASHNMRMPDLAVTGSPFDTEERAVTGPVLIVEVLSPSNHLQTWSNVWTYTSIPSVHEILVLRWKVIGAELLRRQGDGSWPANPDTIGNGDVTLASLGLCVPLAALYRKTSLAAR